MRCGVLLFASLLITVPLAAQDETHAVITLERTNCFGTCPVYSVRIAGDGSVDYEGKQFVRVIGRAHATIAPDEVATLVDEFEKIGYFSLQDSYRFVVQPDGSHAFVTDRSTTTTSIQSGTRRKTVVDYVGAPAALRELERRIDAVAGTMRWISVTPDVVLELQRGGWNTAGEDAVQFLREAVERNDAATADALLNAGTDPNKGMTPPIFLSRNPDIITLLASWGADVNRADPIGETPLMWAARSGVAASVRALLRAGARVDLARVDDGHTALQIAMERAAHPLPPFPGDGPEPAEFDQIIALLRAAGAK